MGSKEEEEEVVESREWVLSSYSPQGLPTSDHLKIRKVSLMIGDNVIPDHHVALKLLKLSVDPYLRLIIIGRQDGLYLPQVELNKVVKTFGVGRVVRSKDPGYRRGDIVVHPFLGVVILFPFFEVADYCVIPANSLRKVDPTAGISSSDYLSSLGLPGFTAWVGMQHIGNPKAGENVFVSAAAGAVGMYAGQLAKLKGCRVVGSTGTDDKVKFLKEDLGFDDAFNYKKETDFDVALSKYFPNGIDIYFDNVGGKMLEAVLNHVNRHARIPLCGMISQYNQVWNDREGVRNLLNAIGKEVRLEGFLAGSHLHRFQDFTTEMEGYIKQGKIKSKYQIYNGIESFLESLTSLFSSSNVGKVIIQVSKDEEP
ncbi:2-alkenal reductase (NADP(+)-dependent)-like [Tasmannia lanceolata]|uniref:2-alkenal reductase (NADP(+)-dependent)-like n=1 Tax=Tasmannia lanceolata TaxID=3420 RepID=UPI0040644F43